MNKDSEACVRSFKVDLFVLHFRGFKVKMSCFVVWKGDDRTEGRTSVIQCIHNKHTLKPKTSLEPENIDVFLWNSNLDGDGSSARRTFWLKME